jgi:hypothetical protein
MRRALFLIIVALQAAAPLGALAGVGPLARLRPPGKFADWPETFRASPKTKIGERYGLLGRSASYSLAELDADRRRGESWAEAQVKAGALKADRRAGAAKQRAEQLRTKHYYPRTWSQRERHKVYAREVADLERLRIERDKRMELALRERSQRQIEKIASQLNANLKKAWAIDDGDAASH